MNPQEEIITANLILPIIKDLVMPKINSIINKYKIQNFDIDATSSNFETYLSQRYEKFLIIDTLVFPNKQTLFKLLYEPLTITTTEKQNNRIQIKIDNYPNNFLPKYIRAIIEDTAGMGKSTITRKLFLSAVEDNAGIPILIELRQINKENDFLTEIQNQLSPIGKKTPIDTILKIINEGGFIFLLDGFDEISKADKEFVIKDLHKFIEKANENYFLITSRQEDSLVSFGDFQKFTVKPLDSEEAHNLITRYDGYSFKPIAEDLIKQLKEKGESLKDFMSNPFLVSLLYKSFDYKKDIPIKKSQFYRQVYDALFESHDLSKEGYLKRDKYSNLHLDDFERVLRHIGYFTSIENKVEYDKDYIINIIEKVKRHTPDLTYKSSDYLRDLLETVPIFKKDGNFIKWAHKSLQDYFTAKFLWIDSKQNQTLILKKIYDDKENQRFFNVLDLFYELDQNLFEDTILLWLLEDFEKYDRENYKNFEHLDSKIIKRRIENTFHKKCQIAITAKNEYEEIKTGKSNHNGIFKLYQDKAKLEFRGCPVNFNYFKKPKLVAFTFINLTNSQDTVLKVISYRIPNLAKYTPHKVDLEKLVLLKEKEVYDIDDKIENIINNEKVFDIVNDLLISDHTIVYDNAFKKLKEIRNRNKEEIKNDFTKW